MKVRCTEKKGKFGSMIANIATEVLKTHIISISSASILNNCDLILQVCNRICKPRQCFSSSNFQSIESFENYFCNPR